MRPNAHHLYREGLTDMWFAANRMRPGSCVVMEEQHLQELLDENERLRDELYQMKLAVLQRNDVRRGLL